VVLVTDTLTIVVTKVVGVLSALATNCVGGSAESGVCRRALIVGSIGDGSEPVIDGYSPVQYDTVVVISGLGNAKVISVLPYAITLVTASPLEDDLKLSHPGLVTEPVHVGLDVVVRFQPGEGIVGTRDAVVGD
jgi:hypothetical protein